MPRFSRRGLVGGMLGLATAAAWTRPTRASTCGPALPLPGRFRGAPGGRQFAAAVAPLSDHDRYNAAVEQILAGNLPAFIRPMTAVALSPAPGQPGPDRVTVFVTPDYLCLGSDDDFLRIPLDLPGASRVARRLHLALPTPRIVDAVYRHAGTVLAPAPIPPSALMRSMAVTQEHQAMIEAARHGRPILPLIAGHKKDLVLTNRLHEHPDRVAIYGWHRPDGHPIQPLSLVHGKGYADYSHGIRLLSRTVLVDGVPMDYFTALADPRIGPVLTREGTIPDGEGLLLG